jgi:hypothetical protein
VTLEQRIVRGFLRQHPRAAARVLELASEEEALEVLSQSEPAEAAAVLEALVPSAASLRRSPRRSWSGSRATARPISLAG